MTNHEPYAPSSVPCLAQLLRKHARDRPDVSALRFRGDDLCYSSLRERANQVGNGLIAEGLVPGDRVAYLGQNSAQYFVALYGAAQVGIVMIPVGWRLSDPEIAHILRDGGVKVLFVGDSHAVAGGARSELPHLRRTLHASSAAATDDFWAWCGAQSSDAPSHLAGLDDAFVQLYTSGTTGFPKGAVLSQRSLIAPRFSWACGGIEWETWRPGEVALVTMPVAHVAGTLWGFNALIHGVTALIAPTFDALDTLLAIQHENVSRLFLVPAALQTLVRLPQARQTDFSRLAQVAYGASPIPVPLLQECMEVIGAEFCQLYGLTETGGAVVALEPADHLDPDSPQLQAAGRAMPGVELSIVGEDGARLPPGAMGEILIRAEGAMLGYWKMPEATAATIDRDGWLHTGDAGYLDDGGYLFIRDRIKDMIVTGGENVYPIEIENVLSGHPQIAEVAVIGVPDDRWGEAVKAVVVARPGNRPSADEILQWSRTALAGFKIPKSVDFVEQIPRTPSGKILKRELRQPYWMGRNRHVN